MLAKILKSIAIVIFLLIALLFAAVTVVDWTPYKETSYYQNTIHSIEHINWNRSDTGYLLAGWAKENITPDVPKPLIPYKPRGDYEFVLDSNFVRTIIVGNGTHYMAFVNYEILFVHPYLADAVRKQVQQSHPALNQLYFTTTHTHSGYGGFSPGLIGKLTMGGFDEEVIRLLTERTIQSLHQAWDSMDTVRLAYKKTDAEAFVTNRLIADDPIDPFIRQLRLENASGESCHLTTYSAHSTLLPGKFMGLSGDYPHYFNLYREKEADFSLFASGTVGSHRPVGLGSDPASVEKYAFKLDSLVRADTMPTTTQSNTLFAAAKVPVELRDSHFRIADNLRIRPWLFNLLYGDSPAHMDVVRIGDNLFISSSGEISGVFYDYWDRLAAEEGLNLFVTCFNGGYIGYITPDEYYHEKLYEVRDMNFFGPYNGAYHSELLGRLVQKAGSLD
ncbi:MAG: neutral/alkaline non-lysosomal ceramidase N-terminal domain-containing protein [Lunatimonas sp.]|uniref:neutral/alkaline non-lysosomal ceramidase N-terminal domain-containing protein n=1 Tax=Lunatimonas sp. TaxID=2060141 RepID=UPI00263B2AC6|nr:neutral/alkaline non-lysosomal ceramidase N-terminal domain-containing protein [Lunatimonas sp.]MCC5936074.1 neutral/alkaline non-lysosomal ceramidase N-terminal domain-containing protein [Lunatimonas sp.]